MSQRKLCTELLQIQGWEVEPEGIELKEEFLLIRIRRKPGCGYRCSRCGEGVLFVHDHSRPCRIRNFPWAGRPCYLEASLARVNCPACGVVSESLDWLRPWGRMTVRFERYVAALCEMLPVSDVAEHLGLNKNTVYRIDRHWLKERAALREQKPVEHLGIDEIALKKGHRYATVFYDLKRREVIGMVKTPKKRAEADFSGDGENPPVDRSKLYVWTCGLPFSTASAAIVLKLI